MKKEMSIEDYHAHPSISKSRLDQVEKSMLHFLERPKYNSKSLSIGSALHDAVLLPDLFEKTYKLLPKEIKVRRGKAWDALQLENPNVEFMSMNDYNSIMQMRDRIFSHPIAKMIFTNGEPEMSYFTSLDINGNEIDVKCRPDYYNKSVGIDLKTCMSAHPDAFRNSITKYRYNVQSAFYTDIIEKVTGDQLEGFIFVAIETTYPYAIGVYSIDQASLDCGRTDYETNLQQIISYNENPWEATGYTDGTIQTIGCTDYYFHKKIKGA